MADPNVERVSKLDTATLSDALDRHGLNRAGLGARYPAVQAQAHPLQR